ncbi:MAG: MBL fold metallo-hydrolase [Gemmatimonadaceae bacterium]
MRISAHPVGPLQANCYIVEDEETARAVIIDPGGDAEQLLAELERRKLSPEAIWLTHAHLDHVGAVAAIKRATEAPILLHSSDRPLYDRVSDWAAGWGIELEQPPPPDRWLAEGDALHVGGLTFVALHTPGHAPGHVVFHGHGVALAGDLLFAGAIGRTDLPFSDPRAMSSSLERIALLDGETVVYPGHGGHTTIGTERDSNPFLNGAARVAGVLRL